MPHELSNSLLASGQGGIDNTGMPTVIQRKPDGTLEAEQKALVKAAEHIQRQMEETSMFASLRDQVEFVVTTEGLRVELVEQSASSFFDTGSATLRPETVQLLSIIADEIGKLVNDVVIEGHTDSRQYANPKAYGNWELSSDRAQAARRVMVARGLRPGQLRAVRGFADNDLRYPSEPLNPRNRRVSIVVRTTNARDLEQVVRARTDSGG
jgi:chemotaxis protein MotB